MASLSKEGVNRYWTDANYLDNLTPRRASARRFVNADSSASFDIIQLDSGYSRIRTISPRTDKLIRDLVLGAGLEPACLSAYAPQTYVSAIPPPEP